jgi:hypothetical protein
MDPDILPVTTRSPTTVKSFKFELVSILGATTEPYATFRFPSGVAAISCLPSESLALKYGMVVLALGSRFICILDALTCVEYNLETYTSCAYTELLNTVESMLYVAIVVPLFSILKFEPDVPNTMFVCVKLFAKTIFRSFNMEVFTTITLD